MFCEKCGTRVEDGQPFCPNCGNRMAAAPAAPAASANPAPAKPIKAPAAVGGLLDKFSAEQGLGKIFYPVVGGLLVLNFILSLLPIYSGYSVSVALSRGYPFWGNLFTVLFTLSITFFVLDYFGKFSFKFLWLFIAAASALILLLYIILWIDSGAKLSVWGWFFFLLQIGLTGSAVMLLLEKMKK